MISVCLLGHSFVSGLLHHLSCISPNPSPQQISIYLKLNDLVTEFHLIGKRGAILSPDFTLPLPSLTNIKPTIEMMQYGSNDLARGKDPLSVASKVIDLCHEILHSVNACQISAIPRINRSDPSSSESLTKSIYNYNGYLKHFCEVEPNINYKAMQGFWTDPISTWSGMEYTLILIAAGESIKMT